MDRSDYDLIEAYLLDKREGPARWAESTADANRKYLRGLADHLAWRAAGSPPPVDAEGEPSTWRSDAATEGRMAVADMDGVRSWAASIRKRRDGRQRSAANEGVQISSARTFYRWVVNEMDVRDDDPSRRLQRPRRPKRPRKAAREVDVNHALRCAQGDRQTFVWLLLLACCGVRCCEIAWMQSEDIHLDPEGDTAWWYCRGKGDKCRWLPIDPLVLAYLRPFLGVSGPVFVMPRAGRPYHPERVSRQLREFFRRIGVRCTPHQWRTFWSDQFAELDPDVFLKADLMGHESVDTTRGYTTSQPGKAVVPMAELAARRLTKVQGARHVRRTG